MVFEKKWLLALAVVAALGAFAGTAAAQDFVASSSLFAVVESNGGLVRSNGVISSSRNGLGSYTVRFYQNTAGCAFEASTGLTGTSGTPPAGEVTVRRTSNKQNLLVNTYNSGGGISDRAFHLIVNCAKGVP